MDKRPDFGKDLAALSDNVTAEVGDVLQALRQKQASKRTVTVKKEQTMTQEQPLTVVDAAEEMPAETPASDAPRRSRTAHRFRLKPIIERDETLDNVTTRLRRQTNELLTETALRQRLKKQSPATRQDIIEAALGDWFRKHGYVASRVGDSDGNDRD